jgi:MATE family multidrug resistance protein
MYQVPVREGESWLRARLRRHVLELVRLALPVIVARAGLIVMALVDTLFVARYGSADLAHLTIGASVFHPLLGTGIGLVIGTLVLSAVALGRERPDSAGAVWQRGALYGAVLGAVFIVLLLPAESLLRWTGQPPDIVVEGARIVRIFAWGMPAALVYTATAYFLEGVKRPLPGMVVMIGANVVNALANWWLVFGGFGVPAMGAEGSAWASTVSRIFLALAMVAYVLFLMPGRDRYGVRRRISWRWSEWAEQRRIGYGAGIAIGVESASFATLTLLAGLIGDLALAAFGIALNLLALIFMVALGIGSATAVRVGVAHGRRDWRDLTLAGWTGLGVNSLIMVLLGGLLWVGAGPIAAFYTADPALEALVEPVIRICAFILIVDGGQVVMSNALRGRGDVVVPTIMHASTYCFVMVPLAWVLAVPSGDVEGLFHAILIASVLVTSLLAARFQRMAFVDRRQAAAAGRA